MTRDGRNGGADRESVHGDLEGDPRLSWLLRRKVSVPDRVPGYLDRPGLVERAMPTHNRLTAIVAPGGFGKTVLLAECCRRLAERGIVAAWLSIDADDGPDVLDSYLAFAFRYAGLSVQDMASDDPGPDTGSYSRAGRLLRVIEARGEPFVLVLDDLQRLSDPRSVALLEFLVRRAPPNLHLAVACRRLPAALDIGGAVLSGTASALTAGDLRFSASEIRKFSGRRLSRRKLAALEEESGGWPMALRIHRNRARISSPSEEREMQSIVENWVESRLWDGMDGADRELLLDAGLFEWMDADLLADALGARDAMRRLESMDALAGLLLPARGAGRAGWQLHPLIREHCARQRLRHARTRYRDVHRRVAVALARRGETLSALRHAAESGDAALAGGILENAGAVRLWIRYGLAAFQAAVGLLDETVLASSPRLQLARCASLLFAGQLAEARRAYRALPDPAPAGGEGGAEDPLWVDDRFVQGFLAFYGGETIGPDRARALMADFRRVAASPANEPLIRGHAEQVLCLAHNAMGQFDAAEDRAERALAHFGGSAYARMLVGFQRGQAAMAQGRVELAHKTYAGALRVARARFLDDPASIAIADVLLRELELERHRRPPDPEPAAIPAALTRNGVPFLAYAAASGARVGRALSSGDGSAPGALQEMLDFAHRTGLPALARYLSAMQVSVLAGEGRADEAESVWREAGLPDDAAACLDRTTRTWREMEALSCARLRLSIAQERFAEARAFAEALSASAAESGLRRTLMRALALAIVLEDRAGDPAGQRRRLEEFLTLFAETDYAWAAVCERRVCLPAVERFLGDAGDSPLCEPAEALLAAMQSADADPALELSEREREILSRLDTGTDKEIAAELDLTTEGVRYHLRKLFSRLGANNRNEAVRRAQELDLLSDDSRRFPGNARGRSAQPQTRETPPPGRSA